MNNNPFSLVAIVKFNNEEAFVLDRPLHFIYKLVGNDFVGADGPFQDYLYYEKDCGSSVAFAGRELNLDMADGSVEKIKNHWWSGIQEGHKELTISSVEALKKCYVFGSASIPKEQLVKLRASYSGCVYPYWDYEKVLRYDDMRRDLYRKLLYQERRCNNIIEQIRKNKFELENLTRKN